MIVALRVSLGAIVIGLVVACGVSSPARPASSAAYPPIVIVWGHGDRAHATAAGDLYVLDGEGRNARVLVRFGPYGRDLQPYGAFAARWSPDRTSVGLSLAVFYADPGSQVAVVSSRGTGLRSLTESWTREFVSWTADGSALIHGPFWGDGGGPFETVPVGGGTSRPLRISGAANRRLDGFDWSPDGRRIAAALEGRGIVTMNADGRDLTLVTRGDDTQPTWSPTGREILFTRQRDNGVAHVYVVKPSGRDARRLATGQGLSGLDWSPDGRKILFTRAVPVEGKPNKASIELWTMDANGRSRVRLPFNRTEWWVLSADWGH